ncbi:hypothetical protein BDQ12DRAFT_673821 [Crucibulum laeve]|uniref:Uncharacterized protein n=1 Tax=Crucibulum laeve TaxID=68775 RepID=A0A5C3MJR7_9AGAR|nr:hypothetical protein BDQ12DRAFT_673821 [Crucibulum laeve]
MNGHDCARRISKVYMSAPYKTLVLFATPLVWTTIHHYLRVFTLPKVFVQAL